MFDGGANLGEAALDLQAGNVVHWLPMQLPCRKKKNAAQNMQPEIKNGKLKTAEVV